MNILPRSIAIPRSWSNLDWASVFSAIIYPTLGLVGLMAAISVGRAFEGVHLHLWHLPLGLAVVAFTVFVCNMGIGPLHRIWQHKAGDMKVPAAVFVMINCIIAMQGKLADWVNYHSQHHSFTDRPGDPHNPKEGIFWAWIGWILFRDPEDEKRPLALWLRDNPVVRLHDRFHISLSLTIHLLVPLAIYALVFLFGGSLVLTVILHACAIIGRGIQFHATVLGINVFGHMNMPKWFTYMMAMLTGGEAFHDHHHDFPKSALHLPKKGILNRVFDYNGTAILAMKKLGQLRDYKVAPQFA